MADTEFDVCSLTEFRRSPSAWIARAKDSGRPLLITRRGRGIAVLVPVEMWEQMNREVEGLAAFVGTSLDEAPAPARASAAIPRVDGMQGSLRHSKLDEDDYRRYLEDKYL